MQLRNHENLNYTKNKIKKSIKNQIRKHLPHTNSKQQMKSFNQCFPQCNWTRHLLQNMALVKALTIIMSPYIINLIINSRTFLLGLINEW